MKTYLTAFPSDVYDAMIDWPKRLAARSRSIGIGLRHLGAKQVLDAACGTGRHAAMFHDWGLEVEGADLSPAMIDRARAAFGRVSGSALGRAGIRSAGGGCGQLGRRGLRGQFAGPGAGPRDGAASIGQMIKAVRPGGVLLVQVLNLWRLADGPCLWQKCLRTRLPQGDAVILKGIHRSDDRGFVELVVADPSGGPLLAHESPIFLGIERNELDAAAREAGAADVQFFGGYDRQPYDRESSVDLLMAARRKA